MAVRAQPISWLHWAGAAAAALVLLAILGPLVTVALRATDATTLGAADWAAIRFTLFQAVLSAAFSVALAIPVARALARRNFIGRRLFVTLLGAPFLLPVIVAVLGLLAVFGRSGWLNSVIQGLGQEPIEIYGLGGVVLAHVFLNLPLAVRLLLQGWLALPAERMRLATTLGFTARDVRRHFERPLLRDVVPPAAALIFLICSTSFAVALILGGGPRATTIELAIYQAFRFEFDLARAALLGVVQVGICLAAGILAYRIGRVVDFGTGLDRQALPWPGDTMGHRVADGAAILCAAAFLVLPLLAVVLQGLPSVWGLPMLVWEAAVRSVLLAVLSAMGAVALAFPMALLIARNARSAGLELVGMLGIAVSPLVIGTGLFIVIVPFADPTALAFPVTGLVNALISLPFLVRALVPAIRSAEATQGRLADALGLQGMSRLRHAILPRVRRPLGFGAGLAAAFSMGDLGVITLFSVPGEGTLPLEMYRLMGSYRTDDAQGAALVLMGLTLFVFWSFDRGGRVHAAT